MIAVAINQELEQYLAAFRTTNGTALPDLLQRSQSTIEKLQQDVKVLRWALYQARQALMQSSGYLHGGVLSLIETAESMTEPANDR